MASDLRAPFPYFGGKRKIADEVWSRFGNVRNYVEPFFGSGAVLLSRPPAKCETVNDIDGMIVNFWRAIQLNPEAVAKAADWPVSELDLVARNTWLIGQRQSMETSLATNPEWCDTQAAGWWVWGMSTWFGSGFATKGTRQIPSAACQGTHRLPNSNFQSVHSFSGRESRREWLTNWFSHLSGRLRDVRICCGPWERVLRPSSLWKRPAAIGGAHAIFLDPPYVEGATTYYAHDRSVADSVRNWALEHGERADTRIALCGYSEHDELADAGWSAFRWKTNGGYSNACGDGNANRGRETIWFSPHCLTEAQCSL